MTLTRGAATPRPASPGGPAPILTPRIVPALTVRIPNPPPVQGKHRLAVLPAHRYTPRGMASPPADRRSLTKMQADLRENQGAPALKQPGRADLRPLGRPGSRGTYQPRRSSAIPPSAGGPAPGPQRSASTRRGPRCHGPAGKTSRGPPGHPDRLAAAPPGGHRRQAPGRGRSTPAATGG